MTCAQHEPLWDLKAVFSAETLPEGTGDSSFRAEGCGSPHPEEELDWPGSQITIPVRGRLFLRSDVQSALLGQEPIKVGVDTVLSRRP